MGQGADSCGGYDYDAEYDHLEACQDQGVWPQKVGLPIPLEKMTDSHLKNAILHVEKLARVSTFECNRQLWETWSDMFERELANRRLGKQNPPRVDQKKTQTTPRGTTQLMRCHCGTQYSTRVADLKRGWGFSCSKSCAAVRRDFGRPAAERIVL